MFEYAVLPTDPHTGRPPGWSLHRRRCRTRLLLALACTLLLALAALLAQGVPPAYDDVRAFERSLPQHAVAALTHTDDDRPARYLRFPGHLWGHGLNNILQEALLMSYLAYVANVSFVFEDYTWSHIPLPWTLYGFALRPTHLPLNAIISGPTAGGPMSHPHAPLAVSAEYYQRVCPEPDVVLSSADAPNDADGDVLIAWWQARIARLDAQCIEVDSSTHDLFDRFLFGGPRVLTLFDALVASPILADYVWSPLVQAALARNFALLQPRSAQHLFATTPADATLDGLLALHLRRGDYARHCPNLATWGADYMGFNQHPALADRFDARRFPDDPAAKTAYYLEHCYPSTDQLVARLRAVRAQHPGLRRVFVLSNDWSWFLAGLARALRDDGWSDVVSTVDVRLDAEQAHVSMAVDMAIAERAEVFVGNGFSSLSANIVLLRLAKGMDPSGIHFL